MKKQTAHAAIRRIEIVEHSATAEFAASAAEQDDRQLIGIVVAMQHARTVHDGCVVEQSPVPFLDFGHPFTQISKLRHEELVERNQLSRLGVCHLMMLVFRTAVGVRFCGAIIAIFQGRDAGRVGAEGQHHNVVHQPPVFGNIRRNPVGRSRQIGCCKGALPTFGVALPVGSLDAPLDLMDATEIFFESLSIGQGETFSKGLGVFEHGIDDAAIAPIAVGAEELIERECRTGFGPGR